ncbi:hypothetical protein KAR26_03175 [Candidatus Parcubacteria bacterium]|nr:hypothetical protein [Candidatus Parcubacteria bacterium]
MVGEDGTYKIGDFDPDLMRLLNNIEQEISKMEVYEVNPERLRSLYSIYGEGGIMLGVPIRYIRDDINLKEGYEILDQKRKRVEEKIPEGIPFQARLKIEDVTQSAYEEAVQGLEEIHKDKEAAKQRAEDINKMEQFVPYV